MTVSNPCSDTMVAEWPGGALTPPAVADTLQGGVDMAKPTCDVGGCARERAAYSWCGKHYMRWKRYGDPTVTKRSGHYEYRPDLTEEERFWSRVEPDGDCWLWTGGLTGSGYGIFPCEPRRSDGRLTSKGAHRYAYETLVGPIPEGAHLDHLCRRPACVNPDHVEPVTPRENTLRGYGPSSRAARKTHCPYGHPYTPENTWVYERNNGRHCRACMRRRWREWKARQ